MPRVTVKLNQAEGRTVLDEVVSPAQLHGERSAAAFIERLGWAIVDAHDQEVEANPPAATPGGPDERKP